MTHLITGHLRSPEQRIAHAERMREWRRTHPDELRTRNRRCFEKRRGTFGARTLAFVLNGRHRAKLLGVPSDLTADELRAMAGPCHYCEGVATGWDHVVPLSRGGGHTASNIVPACGACNSRKSSRTPDEWRMGVKAPGHPGAARDGTRPLAVIARLNAPDQPSKQDVAQEFGLSMVRVWEIIRQHAAGRWA